MNDRTLRRGIAVITAVSALLLLVDLHGPVRFVVLATFVLACPGVAWSRHLRIGDPTDLLAVGIATSIAVGALLTGAMALTQWWRPGVAFAVLALLTVGGLLLPIRERPRAQGPEQVPDSGDQLDQTLT